MQNISRRKLALGLAGAAMTALSIVAVAPAGATTPATPAMVDQLPIVTAVPTNDAGVPAYIITGYGAPVATPENDPDDRNTDTADTGANQDNGGGGETVHTVPADQG